MIINIVLISHLNSNARNCVPSPSKIIFIRVHNHALRNPGGSEHPNKNSDIPNEGC